MNKFANVLRIVEFVEIYKILGATQFYFYNRSITSDVDKILRYYQNNENVQVNNWNISNNILHNFALQNLIFIAFIDYSSKELEYEAISACYHDCYFRASIVENFKYIVLVDIDEIIVPIVKGIDNLLDFLHKIDDKATNSFNFQNVFLTKSKKANPILQTSGQY